MNNISIGDRAKTFLIQMQNARLKATANRLGLEISTGQTADISGRLSGDFSMLSGIEASLRVLKSYKSAGNEAAVFAKGMQISLGVVQEQTTDAVSKLLLIGDNASQTQIGNTATDISKKFQSVVSAFNTQIGGRSLFAGVATDGPAIAAADSMMNDLKLAVAGQTTAAGVKSVVSTWFDTPSGGYETSGYLGATTPLSPVSIGKNRTADLDVTALDPVIRETLKGLALGALVAEGVLDGNLAEQGALLQEAGGTLVSVGARQTGLRAKIGAAEAQIDSVLAQNTSEVSALELTRSELLSVDPYDTATSLKAVQTQLEVLYSITARMSRLSLVDFLR